MSIENQFDAVNNEIFKPVILVVDDNPGILQSVNHILSAFYKVYALAQSSMIETILSKITPDLFLIDYKMPILSGFDLIPIIRSIPAHKDTPIVFLTSDRSDNTINAAFNSGVKDFVTKPIDDAILLEKVGAQITDYLESKNRKTKPK